jgi:hypothetical protein
MSRLVSAVGSDTIGRNEQHSRSLSLFADKTLLLRTSTLQNTEQMTETKTPKIHAIELTAEEAKLLLEAASRYAIEFVRSRMHVSPVPEGSPAGEPERKPPSCISEVALGFFVRRTGNLIQDGFSRLGNSLPTTQTKRSRRRKLKKSGSANQSTQAQSTSSSPTSSLTSKDSSSTPETPPQGSSPRDLT